MTFHLKKPLSDILGIFYALIYIYIYIRDVSRFSNILFNYRISIRLCDYFLKVYQGLTIKTV